MKAHYPMKTNLILFSLIFFCLWGSEPAHPAEGEISDQIKQADQIAQNQEQIGKNLLAVLSDEKSPEKLKVECAVALGKLRYTPALPKLIELLEVVRSRQGRSATDIELIYPCFSALKDYETAAVPSLVEAYIRETGKKRESLLWFAMRNEKSKKTAIIYAKGLMTDEKDEKIKAKLTLLIASLESPN